MIQISTPNALGIDAVLAGQLMSLIGKAYPNAVWPAGEQTGVGFVLAIPKADIDAVAGDEWDQ